MSAYKRVYISGGTYFFTLVTYRRRPIFKDDHAVRALRDAFRVVHKKRPFHIDAIVVLPDHLHCIMKLPDGDSDYSGRWREIKKRLSWQLNRERDGLNERQVWQRRFWEHHIRDKNDWEKHMDYIHYNPVKHALVSCPADWRWSSFHKLVAQDWYQKSWGLTAPNNISDLDLE